ncbi:MAG: zinc ABC transporter substrate-binding protein [Alphaproteobacteria bacterium]|nr:zinc ABC transporter substrate-binding protein [Alphaproteobacteria bacterium]
MPGAMIESRTLVIAVIAAFALALGFGAAQAEPPRVVVSIKPIHSLVAGVMQGVGAPTLLISGAGSPHSYALRPSEARALGNADIIFWVGPGMEDFLAKPLATLSGGAVAVALATTPGIEVPNGGEHDMHIWLDPANAKALVRTIALELSEIDEANTARYAVNAAGLSIKLDALLGELRAMLAPVKAKPYITFHDAYGYFEHRFGLASAGAIAINPDRKPGARRLYQIRDKIAETGVGCVFREPQFAPRLVATVIEGSAANVGVLDPLGAALAPGPQAYFELMRGLARSLVDCLSKAP